MKKQGKHYTPKEKVAILSRHLVEGVPISDLCDELGLQPTVRMKRITSGWPTIRPVFRFVLPQRRFPESRSSPRDLGPTRPLRPLEGKFQDY